MIGNTEIIVRGKINDFAAGDEQNWALLVFDTPQFSIEAGAAERFEFRVNARCNHCLN